MAKYAVLVNNVVTDLIVASSREIEASSFDAVEVTEENLLQIGWIRDPETGVIAEPANEPVIPEEGL